MKKEAWKASGIHGHPQPSKHYQDTYEKSAEESVISKHSRMKFKCIMKRYTSLNTIRMLVQMLL